MGAVYLPQIPGNGAQQSKMGPLPGMTATANDVLDVVDMFQRGL